MTFAAAALLLALVAAPQQNVTGKWDGTVSFQREDGSKGEEPLLLILEQKDKSIAGTVGGNEGDRHPITSGAIDGNTVTIAAKNTRNGREYKLELTLESDVLKGVATSGSQQAQVEAKKRKE